MSSYNDQKNESIVPSGNGRRSRSSSNVIRRGFNSANQSQSVAGKKSLQPPQTPSVQTKAKNFLRHGLDKLNRGNYPGALEDFKQALQVNPNFTEAYVCQSIIRYYQGDHQ